MKKVGLSKAIQTGNLVGNSKDAISHDRIAYLSSKKNCSFDSNFKGVDHRAICGEYIFGYHLTPNVVKHRGVVVVFGGSEGSYNPMLVSELLHRGYEVYAMYYFGQKNQQSELQLVPLDFFDELQENIKKNAGFKKPLILCGSSKGAELALLLASKYPNSVNHLILYSPSAYVFQGITSDYSKRGSSWTFQGKELPFIALDTNRKLLANLWEDFKNQKSISYLDIYQYGIEYDKNKEKARIDLSLVQAKMLIFAGGMDKVWPSVEMAKEIKNNYKGECQLVIFDKAGHTFGEAPEQGGIILGGDDKENMQAKVESDRILFQQLDEWNS